ncbi:E3 ubiquitin-protein ligase herc2, partial [Perkinsus olseni]
MFAGMKLGLETVTPIFLQAQIFGEKPRHVIDAYEFVAISILLAARLSLEDKLQLLFKLFHLNTNSGGLAQGELSLLLRSVTRAVAKFHRSLGTTAIDADIPKNLAVDDFAKDVLEQWGTKNGLLTRQNLCRWAGTDGTALRLLLRFSRSSSVILAFGDNHRYQCGVGIGDPPTIDTRPIPLLSMDSVEVVKIAAGESHSLFLDRDGRLFACGSGFCGILGMGNTLDCTTPKLVPVAPQDREGSSSLGRVKVIDIATGIRHTVAVTDSGDVYCWGNNDVDQLGLAIEENQEACLERAYDHRTGGTFTYASRPTLLGSLKRQGIRARMAESTQAMAASTGITLGKAVQREPVNFQEHMTPECVVRTIPIPAEINFKRFDGANYPPPENSRKGGETAREGHGPPGKIVSLACGAAHIIAIDDGHNAWAWGDNSSGQLAHSSPEPYSRHPQLISSVRGLCVKAAAGRSMTMLMTSLLRWGIHSDFTASLHNRVTIDIPENPGASSSGTRMDRLPTVVYGLPLAGATEWTTMPQSRPARSTPLICIEDSPKDYGTPASVIRAMNPALRQSIVLLDRGLSEGTWLMLSSSDGGFRIHTLSGGTAFSGPQNAIPDHSPTVVSSAALAVELMAPRDSTACEFLQDCQGRVCVFGISSSPEIATIAASEGTSDHNIHVSQRCRTATEVLAKKVHEAGGKGCIVILPPEVTTTDLTLPHDTLPADFFTGCISTTDGRRLIELMKAAELEGTPPRGTGEDIHNLRTGKVSDSELLPASGDTKAHPGRNQFVGEINGRETHVLPETGEGCPALTPLIFPRRNEWSSAHLISVRYDPLEEKLVDIASYKPSAILIAQSEEEEVHVEAFKLPQGLERGDCP